MTTFLSVIGTLLMLLGIYEIATALNLTVTVTVADQTVANFQMLQIQLADIILGGFAFLSGSVFFTAAVIVSCFQSPTIPNG